MDAKVGTNSLWDYLATRSGILFEGENPGPTSSGSNSFRIRNAFGFGTAAAIDQRGYFLTAAHCVEKSQRWLLFLREGKLQAERPRIVWRGGSKEGELDLAILCVSHSIGPTFQWAEAFTNGSQVVDLGLRLDGPSRHLKAKPQYLAGRVLKVSAASTAGSLDYTVVSHSSPLRPGDSGGPLVLPDGRLLGVNVSVEHIFQWSHLSFEPLHGTAHRPDLVWLRKVIDADAALFPREISSP
jgi:S1-C subfamily serine protease